jgi:phage terminase small subunit
MLTNNQENFCQLVAAGNSYASSYKGAYNAENMGINTIYVKSSELMSEDKITVRVKELQAEHKKRNEVTLDEVLQEMAEWLRFNVKSVVNADGSLKSLHEMTDQESSSIASFEVIELFSGSGENRAKIGELKKVKLIDKQAVADKFMKFYGAYSTKVKIDVDDLSHLKDLLNGIAK